MPSTAVTLGVDNPFEPESNLDGGVRFLRGLLDRYHGDLALALGAYNAGPRRVDEFGGVPPIPETQAYVRSVLDRAGLAATSLGSLD
jgi:soluble lytic murein transglycosylase-like protein